MSVATAARPESTAAVWSPQWIAQRFSRVILHVAVIGLTIVWIVPTVGLLVSSFRPAVAILNTGWWTAFSPPFQFTLQNYRDMLDQSNLGTAIFNSFTERSRSATDVATLGSRRISIGCVVD